VECRERDLRANELVSFVVFGIDRGYAFGQCSTVGRGQLAHRLAAALERENPALLQRVSRYHRTSAPLTLHCHVVIHTVIRCLLITGYGPVTLPCALLSHHIDPSLHRRDTRSPPPLLITALLPVCQSITSTPLSHYSLLLVATTHISLLFVPFSDLLHHLNPYSLSTSLLSRSSS